MTDTVLQDASLQFTSLPGGPAEGRPFSTPQSDRTLAVRNVGAAWVVFNAVESALQCRYDTTLASRGPRFRIAYGCEAGARGGHGDGGGGGGCPLQVVRSKTSGMYGDAMHTLSLAQQQKLEQQRGVISANDALYMVICHFVRHTAKFWEECSAVLPEPGSDATDGTGGVIKQLAQQQEAAVAALDVDKFVINVGVASILALAWKSNVS